MVPDGNRPARVGLALVGVLVAVFVPAGRLDWPRGWLFVVVLFGSMVSMRSCLRRANPGAPGPRAERREGTKPWDRPIHGLIVLLLVATVSLAALDDGRFHWSAAPWWVCGLGYALFGLGMAGLTWARSANPFFEPTVRIQQDRGHRVVDAGPYSRVRHPGYDAMFLVSLGVALAIGSYWALVPAGLFCVVLVVRTAREDRTLRQELPGYAEYAQRVRYRLAPGIW